MSVLRKGGADSCASGAAAGDDAAAAPSQAAAAAPVAAQKGGVADQAGDGETAGADGQHAARGPTQVNQQGGSESVWCLSWARDRAGEAIGHRERLRRAGSNVR